MKWTKFRELGNFNLKKKTKNQILKIILYNLKENILL